MPAKWQDYLYVSQFTLKQINYYDIFAPTMEHADQKYMDALLNKDEVLLREIYERFSGKIKGMVLHRGGNEEDAKDIFQEALLSIFNRAKNGAFALTCPFEGLLYLICKRKWAKELKKRNKLSVTMSDEAAFNTRDGSAGLAEECEIQEARRALIVENLMKLGEKCRQLLYLSWEGNTMEEVATLLHVTYGYARKKKSECVAKLIDFIHQSPKYHSLKR